MSDELKKKILEKYEDFSEKDQILGTWPREVAKNLSSDKNEQSKIIEQCRFLEDDEFLEKVMMTSFGKETNVGTRITSEGKKALTTILDPEWVKQHEKEIEDEKVLKKKEIETRTTNLKWTKYGIIGAIALGAISLLVAILKP